MNRGRRQVSRNRKRSSSGPKGAKRATQDRTTIAVDSIANRRVAGLRFASDLSGFFAMVEVRLAGRYKLFLRLGIGDGTFPRSAKMRQKAPFRLCDSRSVTLRRSATFGCPRTHPNTELPTGISSGCVHRSVPERSGQSPVTGSAPWALTRASSHPVDRARRGDAAARVRLNDVIDDAHTSVMSCQHSRPMGRFAGHNVVADPFGLPMLPLRIES